LISLTQLVEERRSVLDAAGAQVEQIAASIASELAAWPEEVAPRSPEPEDSRPGSFLDRKPIRP